MKENEKDLYYLQGLSIPETPAPGQEPKPWQKTETIGKRVPRVDAYERVSGAAVYPSDIVLPEMIYGAILRCPHPNALVKKLDISAAIEMPGVLAVVSGSDPEARLEWNYSKEIKTALFEPHCRFEGEPVAAVAAETPYQAWDALRAVNVQYEVLPFVADERDALKKNAPSVHAGGNLLKTEKYERGNVEKGFIDADVVLEENYRTQCELHTPLELHGCVAQWNGDRLTLWESTQGVYAVQEKVAEVLGMPLSKVRVIGRYMGGGFGSKLQAGKYTIIAALLAKKAARPVKLFLTREETYLAVGNRPPNDMRLKAGVKKDGTLTALDFCCTGTGGAYPSGGTSLVDWLIRDLYKCPNVRTECTDVYIHAGPARPFRAPGHPQAAWALEQMMDALAKAIHMDPVELRLKNIPDFSQAKEGNPPYTTTGLRQCLEEGARAFGWEEARKKSAPSSGAGHIKRGVGMASCLWFVGGGWPPSTVILKLFSDGSMNLNMGASDIGTGTKTVMALVAAEELGIRPEMIEIEHADTGTTQYATPSGGSKTVPTEAPTVRAAAISIKQQLLEMAAKDLQEEVVALSFKDGNVYSTKEPSKKIRIADISGLKKRGVIVGVGYRGPNPENKSINPFAAQFCEVEVNTKTGEVKILRFLGTNDSGRVMDRLTYDSQVIGGITMGIGLAMTEYRVLDRNQTGKMLNRNWHDYKLPTAMDVPDDIVSLPIELVDTQANTTGAKGLGEPVTIPTAPAIANAVYHATGIRITETPISPGKLIRLLAESRKEG
ncbi:xanthine dehydrogenase family protein molybdopterin-binding subunit [Desulforhabdus amnigena]|jgi:xanthine dehydrogenase YagR molybdenum-binding subunit|uniref:Dehydrogenase n=1 Tax=Desulforhabdus amnigena TaxID=40218 RepID=A0A9W6CZB4_9BACT|nr:xanthine dehydrogenase family protein molybdopterin-binding subunit [Desulforhabdus amnigena]NLJ27262.1 xanthine dehydrogenase family protein molybdopterin-binding subunit [Deltaproteobacteria bacterium]GLI32910.1 dehydrogenase [Desulforhabdus amnigena]